MAAKAWYKKLNTRGHFTDFWHRAESWRRNKKIAAKNERQKLKRATEKEKDEAECMEILFDSINEQEKK